MAYTPKIIAEIGWNHMGDMDLAKTMIDAAKESGADFAKFQSWSVQRLKAGEWDDDGRRQIYEKAELTPERHEELIAYCREKGIEFLTSVCSVPDAELVASFKLSTVKIPSLDCRNLELVQYCLDHFQEVIVSTGTSTMEEVKALVALEGASERLTLMHCVSSYPCLPENANLPKIEVLQELHPRVGYSDHTQGVLCSILAMQFEPVFLEKHFTTDKTLPG
ncbi:MAG: N-acetylneuraminate synthase family protein, partial [Puniceicoccales bacterium]